LREFISIKGVKAIGNRLTQLPVLNIDLLDADLELENKANAELEIQSVDQKHSEGEGDLPTLFD
jgi:hypothetical protein